LQSFVALFCLVAAVAADGPGGHLHAHAPAPLVRVVPRVPAPYAPAPYAPAPVYAPAPAYGPAPAYREPDFIDPPAYEFGYGVQADSYTGGANFGHNENRNGYATNGEYRVELPDGRTQIVTYSVGDANTGYVADVRYEGQAIPYVAPKPAYGPAPVPAYGRAIPIIA